MYVYVKALHIIFIVTWFSGLFYMVRLFIYHRESNDLPLDARAILQPQYRLMIQRLWLGITWPSAIVTLAFGGYLLTYYSPIPTWLWWKLCLVVLLYIYHFSLQHIYQQQMNGKFNYSSTQLRIWNEVATVFLTGIVFLVVVKQSLSLVWAMLGLLALIITLVTAIYVYKKYRGRQK
jgi:protoporphyrinogen IX oxidase